MALLVVLILSTLLFIVGSGAQSIGVCNGGLGNNLPDDGEVVGLYKANGIEKMRIYSPNQNTLEALRGSNIELILDAPDVRELADPSFASQWVQNNVIAYYPDVNIRYIAVGNEINPGSTDAADAVFPAMQNVHNALVSAGIGDEIKVSTATYSALLGVSHPPSEGSFRNDALSFINPIVRFLSENNSPLLVNIYPYFSYKGDPQNIPLSYALFTATDVVVLVRDQGLEYTNLFDAMLDSTYAALEKVDGGSGLDIIVSESGWPSDGGFGASMDNAGTYYTNLKRRVESGNGTPRRPGKGIQVYLFAMFDENQKTGEESEKHFGLFTPAKQSKYQLF